MSQKSSSGSSSSHISIFITLSTTHGAWQRVGSAWEDLCTMGRAGSTSELGTASHPVPLRVLQVPHVTTNTDGELPPQTHGPACGDPGSFLLEIGALRCQKPSPPLLCCTGSDGTAGAGAHLGAQGVGDGLQGPSLSPSFYQSGCLTNFYTKNGSNI